CLRPGEAGEIGRESESGRERGSGESAEVHVATKIQFEDLRLCGTQLNEIGVDAELEIVAAPSLGKHVREFVAALDAVDGGIRFASEIGKSRNVDADFAAARHLRETEVQAATGILEAELVDGGIAEDRVVLESDVEVARLVVAGSRAGVL